MAEEKKDGKQEDAEKKSMEIDITTPDPPEILKDVPTVSPEGEASFVKG